MQLVLQRVELRLDEPRLELTLDERCLAIAPLIRDRLIRGVLPFR